MKMSEKINELATALVVAQGLIQNPTKSVSNAFFKSKYADLAGVIDVCPTRIHRGWHSGHTSPVNH
jgi:hypothetical protein